MPILRTLWFLLAAFGALLTYWESTWTMMEISSCDKLINPENEGWCFEPITEHRGYGLFVVIGAAFILPALIAATAMRRWVSWTAAAAYLVFSVVAFFAFFTDLGMLVWAAPLFLGALLLAAAQSLADR